MALLLAAPLSAQIAQTDGVLVLSPFDVTATKPVGYGTSNALGATRVNLAITDTSHSIVILNRELMDDVGTLDGLDILKYASGVAPASTRTINVVTIRGEEIRPNNGSNFLDGLPGGTAAEIETEFIDRIEFVKGPAGSLYGSHSLGGVINRVTKRPLNEPQTVLKTTFNSVGATKQGSLDTTGPLGKSGLSFRLIGVIRDGETPNGAADNKQTAYAVISYAPEQSSARLWTRFSYQHIETGHESPNWFYDGAGQPSAFLGADFLSVPAASYAVRDTRSLETGFETGLNGADSNWTIRVVGRYDEQQGFEYAIIPLGYNFYNAAGTLIGATGAAVTITQPKFSDANWVDIRLGASSSRKAGDPAGRANKQYGAYFDVVGDFPTGPIKHKLLLYGQLNGARSVGGSVGYSLPAGFQFSVINPVYSNIQQLLINPVETAKNIGTSSGFNFGAQDNLFLFDNRLILVGGARFDYALDNGTLNERTGVRAAARTRNNWVYKAGAIFKPLGNHDGISLFYNYAETFTAQAGTNLTGVPFKDISGVANEIGIKLDLPKQGLVLTASVFENKNTNFPIRVLNPALGLDDFFQIGTGVSKGWEADISWQPNQKVSFLFALSDVDSKNPNGLRKRNVQNGFNYRVVGKYKLSQHVSAGAALVDIADRAGDNNNTFVTRGYQTVDLFFIYGIKQWKAQLNLTNLFDGDGVESDIVASLAQVQSPRSARVSIQYSF